MTTKAAALPAAAVAALTAPGHDDVTIRVVAYGDTSPVFEAACGDWELTVALNDGAPPYLSGPIDNITAAAYRDLVALLDDPRVALLFGVASPARRKAPAVTYAAHTERDVDGAPLRRIEVRSGDAVISWDPSTPSAPCLGANEVSPDYLRALRAVLGHDALRALLDDQAAA